MLCVCVWVCVKRNSPQEIVLGVHYIQNVNDLKIQNDERIIFYFGYSKFENDCLLNGHNNFANKQNTESRKKKKENPI